jgi:hypothetical protein
MKPNGRAARLPTLMALTHINFNKGLLMKFAYFFTGTHFSSEGAAFATVQIRPIEASNLQQAGLRIDIRIPIHTQAAELSVRQLSSGALQAAQQLLPESSLAAWAAGMDQPAMTQPCLPEQALGEWLNPLG